MKMPPLSILAATLAAALTPLIAGATPAGPGAVARGGHSSLFDVADVNHDGMLSRSEVPQAWADLRTHFNAVDLDHDHRLSEPEFNIYLTALVNRNWALRDGGVPLLPISDRAPKPPMEHLTDH